jgi:hypothetical protein
VRQGLFQAATRLPGGSRARGSNPLASVTKTKGRRSCPVARSDHLLLWLIGGLIHMHFIHRQVCKPPRGGGA